MRILVLVSLLLSLSISCLAQSTTLLDLRTQTKQVDFANANSTRPVKTGTTLPTNCSTGELYFKSDAVPGANLYGCVAANTWQGLGSGGSGALTVQVDGVPVGSRPILSISSGPGIINTGFDSGSAIVIQHNVDTATTESRSSHQAGASLLCNSADGSATTYTCSMSPALSAYTTGMVVHWRPDVSASSGTVTLNIDGLGAVAVVAYDLSTPLPTDILAGQLYDIWYDGAVFRLRYPPAATVQPAAPSCSASTRGRFWLMNSASGIKDQLAVCAKDASNAYNWRVLY